MEFKSPFCVVYFDRFYIDNKLQSEGRPAHLYPRSLPPLSLPWASALTLWTLVWAVFNWFKKRLLATKAGQMGLLFLSQESSSGCYCSCLAAVVVPTALIKAASHQTFLVQSGIFNIFGFYEFTERRWLNPCSSIHEWWHDLVSMYWIGVDLEKYYLTHDLVTGVQAVFT